MVQDASPPSFLLLLRINDFLFIEQSILFNFYLFWCLFVLRLLNPLKFFLCLCDSIKISFWELKSKFFIRACRLVCEFIELLRYKKQLRWQNIKAGTHLPAANYQWLIYKITIIGGTILKNFIDLTPKLHFLLP